MRLQWSDLGVSARKQTSLRNLRHISSRVAPGRSRKMLSGAVRSPAAPGGRRLDRCRSAPCHCRRSAPGARRPAPGPPYGVRTVAGGRCRGRYQRPAAAVASDLLERALRVRARRIARCSGILPSERAIRRWPPRFGCSSRSPPRQPTRRRACCAAASDRGTSEWPAPSSRWRLPDGTSGPPALFACRCNAAAGVVIGDGRFEPTASKRTSRRAAGPAAKQRPGPCRAAIAAVARSVLRAPVRAPLRAPLRAPVRCW